MTKRVSINIFLIAVVIIAIPLAGRTQTQAAAAAEPAYTMKIDFDVRVKMRDGVELSADLYRPDAEGKFPVILNRTPYTKPGSVRTARYFVERGYVFVALDVRGRGDSDGKFVPYRNDGQDGYDAVEWCAAQPWSTGKVGTIGGSYNGRIQWLTAVLQPPHLTTMIVLVTPSDTFVEWPTGTHLPMDISWYHFTAGHVSQNMEAVDWTKIQRHLPLYTMDEAVGRPSRYWKEDLDHPVLDDYWEAIRYQNKFDRVKVPVLHISGWYDDEQIGTPLNFVGMTTKGPLDVRNKQKLLMGPWPHAINSTSKLAEVEFGPTATIDLNGYWLRWLDYWLKGKDTGIMAEPPVRVFVMGENKWTDEAEWPIGRTLWTKYYIHSQGRANSLFGDGVLSERTPADEPSDSYTNDPERPVPFITEPSFAQIGSAEDYRPVERRDDVLVYTSEPLAQDLTVCGPIQVELYASTSAKDVDFMGMLIDVWPEGYAQRLIDGMVRARYRDGMDKASLVEPGKIYAYTLNLWNTCQTFKKGHRIRLQLASSAFPKYDRNPQTGENLARATKLEKADLRIYHDKNHPSHIILPVVPAK
ncbi:MAG: hydrolase CocE/NonD family protein [Candidatus Aminicenantes bacterium]|nr:hydrolase CocE/NonD family protein [Candidatus Aminicenantes bacterium]